MALNRQITTDKGKPEEGEVTLTAKEDVELSGETVEEGSTMKMTKNKARSILKKHNDSFDVSMD